MLRPHSAALLAAALFLVVLEAPGQAPGRPAVHGDTLALVDSLSGAGRRAEALAVLEALLEGAPGNVELWVRAAREGLALGLGDADEDAARAWLRRAAEHAGRAAALEPEHEEARYLRVASVGRLGQLEGSPTERARLAAVVDSAARSLVRDAPLHAGAHHVLGQLYAEIASLSWVWRIFARPLLGSDLLSRATWEAAEEHLRRAVALHPERNAHLTDLGALLLRTDRREEARTVLEAAVAAPLEFPEQETFRAAARLLLLEAGGGSAPLPPFPAK